MKRIIFLFVPLITLLLACNANEEQPEPVADDEQVNVLLIGTSHWNNYGRAGADIAQANEIDILSEDYQQQLQTIANNIAQYKPSKIFVERPLSYQDKLDSLYQLYRTTDWGLDKRNEIYQLGFRVADALDHDRVYGIDYRETEFNFGAVMQSMEEAGQQELIDLCMQDIKDYEATYNALVANQTPLAEILLLLNSEDSRRSNLGWYYNAANRAGKIDSYEGSVLVSEWLRRNLSTYAMIQKYTQSEDKTIMILMGAGHTAVLHDFIQYQPNWNIIDLTTVF